MEKYESKTGHEGGDVPPPPPYSSAKYLSGSTNQEPPNVVRAPSPRPVTHAGGSAPSPSTVVVQVVNIDNVLQGNSTRVTCPHCQTTVQTRVEYQAGICTHVCAVVLCLICCPCVFIPYCCTECQDAQHFCPKCQRFIGLYRRA